MNKNYIKNYFKQVIIKGMFKKFPNLYIAVQKFRYRNKRSKRKIVDTNTDIIIEGYPRSANSFSVKAFRFANGENYKIATHLHVYPQVIVGVQKKIPTLVLIREPFDCLASYAALRAQNYGEKRFNKDFNIKWLLQDYVIFYKNLLPYKDDVVIGVFSEVLKDYGKIITKINDKYGTKFIPFDHTSQNVAAVFSTAKTHLSPSKERDAIKQKYIKQITELKKTSLFNEASKLYKQWSDNS